VRRALAILALVLAQTASTQTASAQIASARAASAQTGRDLFVEGCASCHGMDARGIAGRGPDLHGAGAAAADFYLRTGRMPLESPRAQPERTDPLYSDSELNALVGYVGSLGGPPVPAAPRPAGGSLAVGFVLFRDHCAGCHQIVGEGGAVVGAVAPPLKDATPTQVAEAVRIGPYVMPAFPESQISDRQLDSLVAYLQLAKHPVDRGGWGLRHLGPIPEGLVAWLLAGSALVLVARAIGERAR
jgi:ubiquinol-cytochrome c reductase cytochrome c subunit